MGKIYILRKSGFFPHLKAKEKQATIKSLFLCYAMPEEKRKGCSFQEKNVKCKHCHKGKSIPFKVKCSRTSLSSCPLSLLYLSWLFGNRSVLTPCFKEPLVLHTDACPALTLCSLLALQMGFLFYFKCELFGGITLFRQHKRWGFTSVWQWKYG